VQQRGVNEHQRDTRKASNDRHKLVQIICPTPGNHRRDHDDAKSEEVLAPFHLGVEFAAAGKDTTLHNADRWEKLQRSREEDSERVEELNCIDKLAVLWEVEDNDSLRVGAIGGVTQGAHGNEDNGDDNHHAAEDAREFLRMLHCLLDRNDKTDSLKSEDCCADKQRPVAVEVRDVRNSLGRDRENVVVIEIDKTEHDEEVSDEGRAGEFGHVTDHGEGEEDDELHEDQPFNSDVGLAIRDGN